MSQPQLYVEVSLDSYLKANKYSIPKDRLVIIRPEPGCSITIKTCEVYDYEFVDRNEGEVIIVDGGVVGKDMFGKTERAMTLNATIKIPIEILRENNKNK